MVKEYRGDRYFLQKGKASMEDGLPVRRVPKGTIAKMDESHQAKIGYGQRVSAFEEARLYGRFSFKHPQPKTEPERFALGDPDQVLGDNGRADMGRGYTLVGTRLPEGQFATDDRKREVIDKIQAEPRPDGPVARIQDEEDSA